MPVDFKRQAFEIPGSKRPGESGIYRRIGCENGLVAVPESYPEVTTIYHAFQNGLKTSPNGPMLGTRTYDPVTKTYGGYVWQTYSEVSDRITRFGSGLVKIHQDTFLLTEAAQKWTFGIWAINRPEWTISSEACSAYNIATVGLYDTLGPDAVIYGINHSECSIIATSADHIASLLSDSSKMPGLKVIISMDSLESSGDRPALSIAGSILKTYAKDKGILLYDWNEVERIGEEYPRPHTPATINDVYTICYTSGTTGMPKGAVITHGNFVAVIAIVGAQFQIHPEDTLISFLPLAHIFGRLVEIVTFVEGGRIGYSTGNQLTMLEDIAHLKPTFFPAVPRLLNRIYSKVRESTLDAPGLKGVIARKAFDVKLANMQAGHGLTHAFWDRVIFNKVRQALGGNVRIILTSSAPISAEALTFLRIAFCTEVCEAYGQSEAGGAITNTNIGSIDAGHVGPPTANCEIKFVDVPDLNYFSTDKPYPRGEICARGPGIFHGYFKDEAKTRETIDEEGWMHTGDIGFIADNGTISIIDRKKNVFKLSQGEYIAVENIEVKYLSSVPFLQQILIHGDSKESFVVAVVVPEPEAFASFASKVLGTKIDVSNPDNLGKVCKDPKLVHAVVASLSKIGRKAGLKGFEIPKAVLIQPEPFSIENGMMTPTFKLKRHYIVDVYRQELSDLYKSAQTADSKL
ncbi:hypothetical protein BGZ76_000762 [Entomortierella beljakovae]|nr:hypothetical protein BGZ76_000762 [Entomortierella beljakovae]